LTSPSDADEPVLVKIPARFNLILNEKAVRRFIPAQVVRLLFVWSRLLFAASLIEPKSKAGTEHRARTGYGGPIVLKFEREPSPSP
jgi:hypothetical protein